MENKLGRKPTITRGQLTSAYYEYGNVTRAAASLKIHRRSFYSAMKRLGMSFKERTIEKKPVDINTQ